MKILFICKGNVGRSQMAEALLKKLAHGKAEAISAGTKLSGPEQAIGELVPQIQEVLDVMNEEGIEVASYKRKNLTEQMVKDADKVIAVIEDTETLPDYLTHSQKLTRWNVPDPKGQDLTTTRKIKDQIKLLIEDLINKLS